MNNPFYIIEPTVPLVPIILSSPHSGVEFPAELQTYFCPDLTAQLDDTDWFVHELYNFAPLLGITMIHAKYSRWVIDLNRDPQSKPLYNDGRIITELVPKTDFLGNDLYVDKKFLPNDTEIARRLDKYYKPYHQKIESLLAERVAEFGQVLLWDAHSVRRFVPKIQSEPFSDLILGDNDGKAAKKDLIEIALNGLSQGKYDVTHNSPFKGGQITRYFGNPANNVHALQLEMVKMNYMDDAEINFSESRADEMRNILHPVFEKLIEYLTAKVNQN